MSELACRDCKEIKPFDCYYPDRTKGKPQQPCKACRKANFVTKYWARTPESRDKDRQRVRAWREANKEWTNIRHLLYDYKITLDQYATLEESQDWCCAICGTSEDEVKLDLDHNHHTGKVRGLLCGGCNKGLGNFADNIEYLKKAITYLEKKGSYADHYTEQRDGHRFRGVRMPDREKHVHGEYY